MKKALALSTAVLAAATAFSFAQNEANQQAQQQQQQQQRQQEQQEQQQQGSAEQVSQNPDQEFVKDVACDNLYEIQLGQLVSQKAQDPQVKQLAQQIVQDHQQAQQQVQRVAQAMQMQVPQQLDRAHQAMLQKMEQKQGKQLETAFAFQQVGDHQKDILMARYQAANAQNPQVKQLAQQLIQPLEQHEHMAWQASEQFVPEARTAGEHIRGAAHQAGDTIQRGVNNATGGGSGSGSGAGQ